MFSGRLFSDNISVALLLSVCFLSDVSRNNKYPVVGDRCFPYQTQNTMAPSLRMGFVFYLTKNGSLYGEHYFNLSFRNVCKSFTDQMFVKI